jgi:catechol-2,3-dioxygenase
MSGNETAAIPVADRRRKDPQSLRLQGLSVALTVDDLERSMRFYCDALGFFVDERWEEDGKLRGVMLKAGKTVLGLSQDDWAKGRDRQKGVGFRIWAETRQDLETLAGRCRSHGVEVEGPVEQWGTRAISMADPDGFKLTIAAAKGDEAG